MTRHFERFIMEGEPVAKTYYSTVFERPADDIWKIIRDFNNYPIWTGGAGESRIEDGKSGETIGGYASGCWRNPTSSGRKPTNFVMRRRWR